MVIVICGVILLILFSAKMLLFKQRDISKPSKERVIQAIQKLHVPFITNYGQIDDRVRFYTNASGGTVFVTNKGEIIYSLIENKKKGLTKLTVLKEEVVNGRIDEIKGEKKAITNVNYFKGKDPSLWKRNIPAYEQVNFGEVYKGIDLKLQVYGNGVEKFFHVKPGGNPDAIKVKLSGVTALRINGKGELEAEMKGETIRFTKPVAYQEIDGERVDVECKYVTCDYEPLVVKDSKNTGTDSGDGQRFTYGFKTASYDKTKELIIDPLLASMYLGGFSLEEINSMAVDPDGNVYVAGETFSVDFPITFDVFDGAFGGGGDAFVSKLDKNLTELLASTFLGGTFFDRISSLAIDLNGNIYVTGNTFSADFPTIPSGFDTSFNGNSDAFVSKLNGDLTEIIVSTYLGGSAVDVSNFIVIGSHGNIYVAGSTSSIDFPVTSNAFDGSFNGSQDTFISKFDENLIILLGSTYLGGTAFALEEINSLAIDSGGNIYATGSTASRDFPITAGTFDTSFNGDFDVFISKLDNSLAILLASTFLGGFGTEGGNFISIDPSGDVVITGFTTSLDFPVTPNAFNTSFNGGAQDVFISKLDMDLVNLSGSTYLGGFDGDEANSLVIDTDGNIYVSGNTNSPDFPTTPDAFDTSYNDSVDVFISKLDGTLMNLLISTYLGGTRVDNSNFMTRDAEGNIYVTGSTESDDFPVTPDAFDDSYNGNVDAFISKFDSELSAPVILE